MSNTTTNRLQRNLTWPSGKTLRVLSSVVDFRSPEAYDIGYLMLDLVANFTNLPYTIVPVPSNEGNGVLNTVTGQWNGMLGYLQRNEADLVLKTLSVSGERVFDFDFLPAVDYEQYGIYVSDQLLSDSNHRTTKVTTDGDNEDDKHPQQPSVLSLITFESTFGSLSRIFIPFESQSWLALFAAFVFVIFQCMLFEFLHVRTLPAAKRRRKSSFIESSAKHEHHQELWHEHESNGSSKLDRTPASMAFNGLISTGETIVVSLDQFLRPLFNQSPTLSPSTLASQIIISCWCVVSVLITTLYAANLTSIFGAAPPALPPFNNISSLQRSNFRILVTPGSSSEQLLSTLVAALNGTEDGKILADIVDKSQPYWTRDWRASYNSLLRGRKNASSTGAANQSAGNFALLAPAGVASLLQSQQCDLRAYEFFYPINRAESGLRTVPMHPISLALQKDSPFTGPLTRAVTHMSTSGMIYALKAVQFQRLVESHQLSNGERFKCTEMHARQRQNRQHWAKLTLRGLLPTFTLFTVCGACAAMVFALERVVLHFVLKQRRLRWLRWQRIGRAFQRYNIFSVSRDVLQRQQHDQQQQQQQYRTTQVVPINNVVVSKWE